MQSVKQKTSAVFISLMMIMLLGLSGCSHATGDFCDIYNPVYTSVNDTPETLGAVHENNAVWMELCH